MEDQNYDFYQSIRNKINSWMQTEEGRNNPWADYILAVPDIFHLLVKLTLDPAVPDNHKAKLGLVWPILSALSIFCLNPF